ncbi:hypothetical protein OC00_03850 [Xanthomonas vasicola]|nr:hypothetical protein KWG_0122215 [Xanthomonas vasicola pv. vasculorum NCPPB 1381]KFA29376.1 hypothetical protein KW5_0107625 [Xanthomonas vasicola pv. vasculorum NCPPB 1326]KFA37138.1 hypothetical protein KWI_0106745 [Xanthomonas vasicola pv. vasculorum NCPPB 206]KGR55233.1 hypothetical protein NX07_02335 [Xanthomonas vasicola]KGR56751.1 hypothetical protein NX09_07325 [Xanthomonas vasicola]
MHAFGERISHFTEGGLDRQFVLRNGDVLLSLATSSSAFKAPARKIGKLTLGENDHVWSPSNRLDNASLPRPTSAVNEMVGNNAARAAPISALAALSVCSADSTSGRCNNTRDSSSAGNGASATPVSIASLSGSNAAGTDVPTTRFKALRDCASWVE